LVSSWLISRYTKNEAGYKMLCTRISSASTKNNLGTCTKLSPKIALKKINAREASLIPPPIAALSLNRGRTRARIHSRSDLAILVTNLKMSRHNILYFSLSLSMIIYVTHICFNHIIIIYITTILILLDNICYKIIYNLEEPRSRAH